MRAQAGVLTVAAPVVAKNGSALSVEVSLRGDPDTADERVAPLLAVTATEQATHPALRIEQVGGASLNKAVNDQVSQDLSTAATISLPVTLIILLVAFGAIIAAGVPVLLALSRGRRGHRPVQPGLPSDPRLRHDLQHDLADGHGRRRGLLAVLRQTGPGRTPPRAGQAGRDRDRRRDRRALGHRLRRRGDRLDDRIVLAGNVVFSSLAAGSIVVVAVAVLGSLTVLPALLVLLGRRIDRPRVPVLWRLSTQDREPRLFAALLRPALRHPGRTLAASTLALVLLALPALGLSCTPIRRPRCRPRSAKCSR